jgi:hypothetical protein
MDPKIPNDLFLIRIQLLYSFCLRFKLQDRPSKTGSDREMTLWNCGMTFLRQYRMHLFHQPRNYPTTLEEYKSCQNWTTFSVLYE